MIVFIMFLLFSCGGDEPVNKGDPVNLSIEVVISDDGSGLVQIHASAENTVNYQLYIPSSEEHVDEDNSGLLEHTFTRTGIYLIEVRAIGSSGRFIKEERQIEVVFGDGISPEDGYVSPLSYDGFNLVWTDEFEGSKINSENWSFEIGDGCPNCGWGNNELQYYSRENAWQKDGVLVIQARKENFQDKEYTSARLISKNLRSFKYGRIDIRALLPRGQGIWPALWMLGNNISSAGWPECGEIDIMEMIGGNGNDNTSHGTVHWGNDGDHLQNGGSKSLDSGIFADEYHVFSILWDESSIKWLLDNEQFHVIDITPESMSEFHQRFFFIFNIAVGGNWPGSPDGTTVFPQVMKADYIRVFQKG